MSAKAPLLAAPSPLDRVVRRLAQSLENRTPGWIGRVPYLAALYGLVSVTIPLRFEIQSDRYDVSRIVVVTSGIILIACLLAGIAMLERRGRRPLWLRYAHATFLIVTIVLLSTVYVFSRDVRSDVFLLYFLPFIYAAEYFRTTGTIAAFVAISVSFFYVVVVLSGTDLRSGLVVFLAREVFFVAVLAVGALLIEMNTRERERRVARGDALLSFKDAIDQLFSLDNIVARTAETASHLFRQDVLDAECAIVKRDGSLAAGRPNPSADLVYYVQRECLVADAPIMQATFDPRLALVTFGGVRSLIAAPVRVHNTAEFAIFVTSQTPDALQSGSLSLLQNIASLAGGAIDRADALGAFHTLSSKIGTAPVERDRLLNGILDQIESYGFDTIGISIVDPYRNVIEMVRGRNVPHGWMRRSKHPLDSPDIIASIARNGVSEIIDGPDTRFNPDIHDRFDHQRLVRAFVPVVGPHATVAVIQAGCDRSSRERVFTRERLHALERLARDNARTIGEGRPFVLFEEIATKAYSLIAADSASIHVYAGDDVVLQAGAGRATAEMVSVCARQAGLLRPVEGTADNVVALDTDEVKAHYSEWHALGVRSVLAVTLTLGEELKGILYVHFWNREHQFTERERELERVFAALMETAIQNSLLVDAANALAGRAAAMVRFQRLIEALAARSDPAAMLDELAQDLMFVLDADLVTLYEYFESEQRFRTPPVMKGRFHSPGEMQPSVEPTSVLWPIVGSGQSDWFVRDVSDTPLLWNNRQGTTRFARRERIKSCAIVTFREPATSEILGVLFVNYRDSHEFKDDEQQATRALAVSAAMAIRAARLNAQTSGELSRSRTELRALHAVDEAIANADEQPARDELLKVILEQAMAATGAPVGMVLWRYAESTLQTMVTRGIPASINLSEWSHGEGIVGKVAQSRQAILAPDVSAPQWTGIYKPIIPTTRSELAVPILERNELLGVLNLEHPTVQGLTADHKVLLQNLAVQAVIANRYADLRDEVRRQERPLRAFRTLADRVNNRWNDPDTVLQLVLTGVTAGQGLAYSRAMVFIDEGERGLQGRVAVGSLMADDALTTWTAIAELERALESSGQDVLSDLLSKAEHASAASRNSERSGSALNDDVRRLCLPAAELIGAIASALNGQPTVVMDSEDDPLRDMLRRHARRLTLTSTFVCVPIRGRKGAIGVVVADQEFIKKQRAITAIDVRYLEVFADLMGIAYEDARLRLTRADDARQAIWNALIADVCHELGRSISLVDVPLFELEEQAKAARDDARLITFRALRRRVADLNGIIDDIRTYTRSEGYSFVLRDIVALVQEAINDACAKYGDVIRAELPASPIFVAADPRRVRNIIVELVRNSAEACEPIGRGLVVTIRVAVERAAAGPQVRIDVVDNGPGVPEEFRERIFERHVTTKQRDRSTRRERGEGGLGLAIVRDVLRLHGGGISAVEGVGAHFVLRLPLAEEVQAAGA